MDRQHPPIKRAVAGGRRSLSLQVRSSKSTTRGLGFCGPYMSSCVAQGHCPRGGLTWPFCTQETPVNGVSLPGQQTRCSRVSKLPKAPRCLTLLPSPRERRGQPYAQKETTQREEFNTQGTGFRVSLGLRPLTLLQRLVPLTPIFNIWKVEVMRTTSPTTLWIL